MQKGSMKETNTDRVSFISRIEIEMSESEKLLSHKPDFSGKLKLYF